MVDKEAEKMAEEPNIQWKSRGVCEGYKACTNGGQVGFVASVSVWTGLLLFLVALDTFYLWVLVGPFQGADTFCAKLSEWPEHPPPHGFPPLPVARLSQGS